MRELAAGRHGDIPVVAGESAVAGFAALKALLANPEWRNKAGLNVDSCVLLISTEGATAPNVYEHIVGRSHEAVAIAQKEWLVRDINALTTPGTVQDTKAP